MRNDFYPEGTAGKLLATDLVTSTTKKVLIDRLEKDAVLTPRYFTALQFSTLAAVCNRMLPQPSREIPIDLPGLLEDQLITGTGNGWRYAAMPEDNVAIVHGIDGLEETALILFRESFHLLDIPEQNTLLQAVQGGIVEGTAWQQLPASLFFEELLARLAELYYSHPLAKEEIGEASYAEAKGWVNLGLSQIEDYEPVALKKNHDGE